MYGYISELSSSVANWAGVTVTSFEGTTAYTSWTVTISKQVFSIKGTQTNSFKWDGDSLDIIGDIGGTIGQINIGIPPTNGIRISSTGIQAWNDSVQTFLLSGATGNAEFKGTINATAGNIAGWTIGQDGVGIPSLIAGDSIFQTEYLQLASGTAAILQVLPGGIDFNMSNVDPVISSTGGNGNLVISADDHLSLRSSQSGTTGRIYVRSGVNTTYRTSDQLLINPTGGTVISTKAIKTDIENVEDEQVLNFIDKIEIKKYQNLMEEKNAYSIIIEDELEKQEPLLTGLINRQQGTYRFSEYKDIPDFLIPYIDTEYFTQESDGSYFFNSFVYDATSVFSLNVKATKILNNKAKDFELKIKKLEQENAELRQIIAKVLNKIGEV
jgi:hypothetical protein